MKPQPNSIPVVDVDSAFPAMVERPGSGRESGVAGDVGPQVTSVLRDVLGWRPRPGDPQAFESALGAAFRLRMVEGHVEADYVPRGYAVQADLGAVTGGQASLYRRATLARTEALRILDGLVALRTDADAQDMESYRGLVRGAVERLVDEIGAAGGPRVKMVDMYFTGLTGTKDSDGATPDTVAGQLGALRDRFGLTDANVNTVEEEGVRTAYWTLVDLVNDLKGSWVEQRGNFGATAGAGFLGTDLILLSRLMEACVDQVDEVESVLDSVLITESERRTIVLNRADGLTLDGLLSWMRDFLSHEGRQIAQDGGRDGIVSALAPMTVELLKTFQQFLGTPVEAGYLAQNVDGVVEARTSVLSWLPLECCGELPAGMYAARSRIAVASLCRLLTDLARTAQRIGRWAQRVVLDVTADRIVGRDDVLRIGIRGINLRPTDIPAFVIDPATFSPDDCVVLDDSTDGLVLALRGSTTADDDWVSGVFRISELAQVNVIGVPWADGFTVPAEALPIAIIDGETGRIVRAPELVSYPAMIDAFSPVPQAKAAQRWASVPTDEVFRVTPSAIDPDPAAADSPETNLAVATTLIRDAMAAGLDHDVLRKSLAEATGASRVTLTFAQPTK